MTSQDLFQRARDVFDAAVALPPAERAAFLDRACTADAELRREVESLISSRERAGASFLTPPTNAVELWKVLPPETLGPAAWAESMVGRRIGRYTLVRLLATGGMGCVFEAQQERPARSVALKLLRPGLSGTSALARFRLEPEVLGRLQHPNIAHVYEAGVHDGPDGPVPFFAMELVTGALTLGEYVSTRELPRRARLELLARVCDAVQHGHQKGVIHRDLKPANILVGADGEPKVIDFGVARATDSDVQMTTMHTHVGDIVGTIRYMSPEQCDGDPAKIDTRSDVYALGVVLYELLTGVSPYESENTTPYTAMRAIKEFPPRNPSELNPALRGDLEAIVLKALSKQPAKRYGSAAELARDIRRHLNGEPIEARPPGRAAKLVRWAIRSPWRATALAGGAMVLAVSVATGWITNSLVEERTRDVLLRRPERLEFDPNMMRLRVVSPAGHTIREFLDVVSPEHPKPIARPRELGGGHMFLVAARPESRDQPLGELLAYSFERPNDPPLWTVKLTLDEIPEYCVKDRKYNESMFTASFLEALDIFPESPGLELVVGHQHTQNSQCMLAIYDQRGVRRYGIWHDGGFAEAYWMFDEGILVLQGLNSVAKWQHRDCDECRAMVNEDAFDRTVDPYVLAAIKPRWNEYRKEWLAPRPDMAEPAPVWYWCLWPPQLYARGMRSVALTRPKFLSAGHGVGVSIRFKDDKSGRSLSFELTANGTIHEPSYRPGDGYLALHANSAAAPAIELRPLPPVIGHAEQPRFTPRELWGNQR